MVIFHWKMIHDTDSSDHSVQFSSLNNVFLKNYANQDDV